MTAPRCGAGAGKRPALFALLLYSDVAVRLRKTSEQSVTKRWAMFNLTYLFSIYQLVSAPFSSFPAM